MRPPFPDPHPTRPFAMQAHLTNGNPATRRSPFSSPSCLTSSYMRDPRHFHPSAIPPPVPHSNQHLPFATPWSMPPPPFPPHELSRSPYARSHTSEDHSYHSYHREGTNNYGLDRAKEGYTESYRERDGEYDGRRHMDLYKIPYWDRPPPPRNIDFPPPYSYGRCETFYNNYCNQDGDDFRPSFECDTYWHPHLESNCHEEQMDAQNGNSRSMPIANAHVKMRHHPLAVKKSSEREAYDYGCSRDFDGRPAVGGDDYDGNLGASQEEVIQGDDQHFGSQKASEDFKAAEMLDRKGRRIRGNLEMVTKRDAKTLIKYGKAQSGKDKAISYAVASKNQKAKQKRAESKTLVSGASLSCELQDVSDIVADIVRNMQLSKRNSTVTVPFVEKIPSLPAATTWPVSIMKKSDDARTMGTETALPSQPSQRLGAVEPPIEAEALVQQDVAAGEEKAGMKIVPPVVSQKLEVPSRLDADTIEVTITPPSEKNCPSVSHPRATEGNTTVDIVWKKVSKRLAIVDPEDGKPVGIATTNSVSKQQDTSKHVSTTATGAQTQDIRPAALPNCTKRQSMESTSRGSLQAIVVADVAPRAPVHTLPTGTNYKDNTSVARTALGSEVLAEPLSAAMETSPSSLCGVTIESKMPELHQKPRPSAKCANGGAGTDAGEATEEIDLSLCKGNSTQEDVGGPGLCSEVLDAVVKIYATHCDPNYSLPWQMRRQTQSTSSGFVISGRRILTNAHSVEHHTVVRVKKRASDQKYIARVLANGNECDLALLTIIEEEFWEDLDPLPFGALPELQASVIVVGYPIGGENISVTAGVVSRVEIQDYTHGASQLLGIQIDAAINSGSSGGPALNHRNEVVGIAFQSLNTGDSENIGYLVAESVVDHFLKDYERNKRYTGFCHCGFFWQRMENISLRRSMKMKDDENGILVRRVNKQSPALQMLREGDIITHIDNISISNAGTVPYRSGERISFHYIITTKFTGDPIKLQIIRRGKKMSVEYELGESSANLLVPVHERRRQPEYLVVAGLVFVALSEPYLADEYGDKWDLKAPVRLLERLMYGSKESSDEQVVVLSQVLNAEINIGYEYVINTRVHKFNGTKLRNLAQLAKLVESCQDDYLRFDLDDEIVVVGRQEAIESSREIMETHCIPSAYSIGDLRTHAVSKR